MPVNLTKSQVIDLKKYSTEENFKFEAGWDCIGQNKTDIDIFAMKKEPGQTEAELVFFNNKVTTWGELDGDNRTGEGDFPDETITLRTKGLKDGTKIILGVAIYSGAANFALVENLKVNINEASTGKELAVYQPALEGGLYKGMVIGELIYSAQTGASFKADIKTYDSLESMLRNNGVDC